MPKKTDFNAFSTSLSDKLNFWELTEYFEKAFDIFETWTFDSNTDPTGIDFIKFNFERCDY